MGDPFLFGVDARFEVLEMRGLLGRSGTCIVDADSLRFAPSAFEGLLGAGGWELPVREITRLARTGVDLELDVQSPSGARRIVGRDVDRLHAQLALAIARSEPTAGGALLLSSAAELALNGGAWASGTLELDATTLRFVGPQGAIALPISSLLEVGFLGSRQALELRSPVAVWHVGGATTLLALGLVKALRGKVSARTTLDAWEAGWLTEPRRRAGQLLAVDGGLSFAVTGRLGALVGGDETIDMAAAETTKVALRREGKLARIDVTTGGVERGFRLERVDEAFARCAEAMAHAAAPGEPPLEAPGITRAPALLAALGGGLSEVRVAMPVVVLSEASTAERGWLWLTERTVRVDAGATKRAMPWPDIHDPEGAPGAIMVLRTDEGAITVLPRGGKEAAAWFWTQRSVPARRPSELPKAAGQAPPAPRPSLLPEAGRPRNRRESYRAPVQGRGAIVLVRGRGHEDEVVVMHDLSMGGCAVDAPSPMERGARCTVRLTMDGRTLQIPCVVAHATQRGNGSVRLGLRFASLTPEQTSDLGDVWMTLQRLELRTPRASGPPSSGSSGSWS